MHPLVSCHSKGLSESPCFPLREELWSHAAQSQEAKEHQSIGLQQPEPVQRLLGGISTYAIIIDLASSPVCTALQIETIVSNNCACQYTHNVWAYSVLLVFSV